jgi:proline racemase
MRLDNVLHLVDAHAEGEVGNVIVGGFPDPPGETMLAKRDHLVAHDDWLRTTLLYEPRGSAAHHANLLVTPTRPDADMGYIIIEPTEYPAMSGSNTVYVATVLLETGVLPIQEPSTVLTLEAPGGLMKAGLGVVVAPARFQGIHDRRRPALTIRQERHVSEAQTARAPGQGAGGDANCRRIGRYRWPA